MKLETFDLERIQSLWENRVDINLTESGLHPYSLKELLPDTEIDQLLNLRLGYGQTNGSIELRQTIATLYPGANEDNVIVTNGSAEANFIAIWSLLNPGDELVLMYPNYMQISGLADAFGVRIKPFYLKEALNWAPDIKELEQLITPKTKMISVCNPNNPTGATFSDVIMDEIIALAKKHDVWILADEIYRGAELDGNVISTFHGKYEKVLVNGGLSKAYGLPGLRLGWLVGPQLEIENAWKYHDYTTIGPGILSNEIANLVLKSPLREKVLARSRKILNENLLILTEWIQNHKDLFHFIPPKAGGMAFIRYNADINSRELSTRLRKEKSVFVVDGDCYGMDHYLRIGFGCEKDSLIRGLNLLDELLLEILKK
ncbi:MAG: aminotransferase class I/II-fold pyridoxal phosphate-dependent enzyme [Deltaproteobacteria bacterium]|jgi:aspartate/methionine/tyrosine aminotransferase|nr:aminotransferase class I/II-fold pyridoxal phosphate-dependent enzyme [Deltaproteobacteria bacterium]